MPELNKPVTVEKNRETCRFFVTYTGVKLPFRLVNELQAGEMENRNTYDPECFDETFQKWKAMAISARREFQRSGVRAIEFHMIPQEFFAWCALNNQENNAASRAGFVSEKLNAAHEKTA